jgi:hypothetical protein
MIRRNEEGSALLMTVFVTSILAGLGIALLHLSEANLRLARKSLSNKKAFYLAESGVENGRRVLIDASGAAEDFSTQIEAAAGENDTIDFDPDLLVARYNADGDFLGFDGYGDDVPLRSAEFLEHGYSAAFLTNDPLDGRTNLVDSNARAIVVGVGIGPDRAFRMVEIIIEPEIILPPMPPAAITLLGENPHFFGGSSNSERYNGEDCHFLGGGSPALNVAIVGATGTNAEDLVEGGMVGSPTRYTSGSYQGDQTAVDLTDATNPLVASSGMGAMDPVWTDCSFLQALNEKIEKYATFHCAGDECELPESTTTNDIVFIEGDVTIGPGYSGAGILAATGEVTILGNSTWTGAVLAIGEGAVTRLGGGNGVISGTTVVADIAGPDEIYGTADDCQPVPDAPLDDATSVPVDTDPFGTSSYSVTGGGNSDIDFCSRFIPTDPHTYVVVDFRQI